MKEKIAGFLGYCFGLSLVAVGTLGLLAIVKFLVEYLLK
jgi:hypothetical protein